MSRACPTIVGMLIRPVLERRPSEDAAPVPQGATDLCHCPRLLILSINKFIDGRISSICFDEDEIEQEHLRVTISLHVSINVMSSRLICLRLQEFLDISRSGKKELKETGIS